MLKKRKNISKVPTRVENIVQMKAGTVCEDLMSIVMS